MNIKSVHTIVFSPCGGTEKVMQAIIKDIDLPKFEHNITLLPNRTNDLNFNENDLVLFGFPVYGGHIPLNAANLFSKIKGNNTASVLVSVYGNRVYEGAFLDMNKQAVSRGFRPVAASAAIVEHSLSPTFAANRPDSEDIVLLAKFGTDVVAQMDDDLETIEPPGNYPDWAMPPADALLIRANESCTSCGVCVKNCPTGAISKDHPQETDQGLCILCSACMKYCPVKARDFVNVAFRQMGVEHLKNAVARKEPEFFFSHPV